MNTFEITPQAVREHATANRPATVTISKTLVTFNDSAKAKLNLSTKSKFMLEVDDYKLYYKDVIANGFPIKNEVKESANAYISGLLPLLKEKGVITDSKKTCKFTLGDFKEGRRELTLITVSTRKS